MKTPKRIIHLKQGERKRLEEMVRKGKWKSREIRNARVLLSADANQPTTIELMEEYGCCANTVRMIKKKYCEEGLEPALFDKPRSGAAKRLSREEEAYIIATACSEVPDGHDHWTLRMLADHFERHKKKHIGTATVYRIELANELKPWQKKRVVHPEG